MLTEALITECYDRATGFLAAVFEQSFIYKFRFQEIYSLFERKHRKDSALDSDVAKRSIFEGAVTWVHEYAPEGPNHEDFAIAFKDKSTLEGLKEAFRITTLKACEDYVNEHSEVIIRWFEDDDNGED